MRTLAVKGRKAPIFYVPRNTRWERAVDSSHWSATAFFLSTIHWRWLCWRADEDGYVRLKTQYLRRVIGRSALDEIRRRLEEAEIIDWDKSYSQGERSMRYRLRPEYRQTHAVQCRDDALTRRIWRLMDENERQLLPVHFRLRERLAGLTFDLGRATGIIAGMTPDEKSPLSVDEYRSLLTESATRLADQIESGEVELTADRFGRVHTAITRLPKGLRCCLSFGGKELVGVDLRNSQPLFCGLVAQRYYRDRRQRYNLRNWQPNQPRRSRSRGQSTKATNQRCGSGQTSRACASNDDEAAETNFTTPNILTSGSCSHLCRCSHSCRRIQHNQPARGRTDPPITMAGLPHGVGGTRAYGNRYLDFPGLGDYLRLCETGLLYEELMLPGYDRGQFKRRLFADVYFGDDGYPSAVRDRFREMFPPVAGMLTDLKRRDYRRPSWLMQFAESRLFIEGICQRIFEERPSVPLVTIHDSLLTTPEHVDYITTVAMDEFSRLGIRPTFEQESYE